MMFLEIEIHCILSYIISMETNVPNNNGAADILPEQNSDYDSAWKDVIEELFEPFLLFFFPHIHADIDFDREILFLSKELRKLEPDHNVGKRVADTLAKVYLKDGTRRCICILIHVEVQGTKEPDFPQRMFVYYYRIFDKFREEGNEVVSLAILTDEDRNYRPDQYSVKRWGFEFTLKIPMVKIVDYKSDPAKMEQLKISGSPMAMVVRTQLESFKAKKAKPRGKFNKKLDLIRQCYMRGYRKEQIRTLLKFIDWILRLPVDLQDELKQEVYKIEEENKMAYIPTWEREARDEGIQIGTEKGLKKGHREGHREANRTNAVKMVQSGIAINLAAQITGLSALEIRQLVDDENKKKTH